MSIEILNLDPLQLFLWTTIVFLVLIIIISFIWNRKRKAKNGLDTSSAKLFDYKNLEPLIHSFSELNEIEKFQLSTLLTDIVTEPKLIKNEKVLILHKFIQKILRVKTVKVKKKPLKYKEPEKTELTELEKFRLKLVSKHFNLSKQDIELCSMIYEGKRTNEIAVIKNLTPGTVRVYKNKLKTKLELDPTVQLNPYLTTI